MQAINEVQQIQIELMRRASFNNFNGSTVADDLVKHRDLWQGFIFDRDGLIKLRDISDGLWNADTLWVLPAFGKADELERLAREWDADDVDWIGGQDACSMLGEYSQGLRQNQRVVLRCWWD